MSTEQSYNQPQTAQEVFAHTRSTCHELMALLAEENTALRKHDAKLVEARLHHKKRLALRLEQMLAALKRSASLWKADANAQVQAQRLAQEVAQFQQLSQQNTALLQAAHQLRADLVVAIRNELEARAPKARLYGSSGEISPAHGGTRLLAREV